MAGSMYKRGSSPVKLMSLVDVTQVFLPGILYTPRIYQKVMAYDFSDENIYRGTLELHEGEQILVLSHKSDYRVKILRESGEVYLIGGRVYPTAFLQIPNEQIPSIPTEE